MGAKQSKRSVDITTTPKKGEAESPIGEGKVEKIADLDSKVTTNGTVNHAEIEYADKEVNEEGENKERGDESKINGDVSETEKEKEAQTPETPKEESQVDKELEMNERNTEKSEEKSDGEKIEETPDKEKKKKEKKKKWSLRSISFSKKDKSKPSKDAEKNGDVKEEEENSGEATSPSTETPKVEEKSTESKEVEVAETPAVEAAVTNGNATAEEVQKVEESAPEPTPAAEVLKEESKPTPPVEEPQTKAEPNAPMTTEEPKPEPMVEEATKEVRTEEIPPPLPSSNPPSPVMVFAESTKADVISNEQLTVDATIIESSDNVIEEEKPVVETPATEIVETKVESETSVPVKAEEVETAPEVKETIPAENIIVPEEKPVAEKEVEAVPVPVETVLEVATPVESVPVSNKIENNEQKIDEPIKDAEIEKPEVVEQSAEIEQPVAVDEPEVVCPMPTKAETQAPEVLPPPSPLSESRDSLPEPAVGEPVANADSIPDISTESLPSLPEPVSETLPEHMSLPPIESLPKPIAESMPEPPSDLPVDTPPKSPEQKQVPVIETIITNGKTNGHLSPVEHMNGESLPAVDEPLKQMPSPTLCNDEKSEERIVDGEITKVAMPAESTAITTEE